MKRILITPQSFIKNKTLMNEASVLFSQFNFEMICCDCREKSLDQYLKESKAEILLVGLEKVTANLIDANPQLEYIAKFGVGLDNLDLAALNKKNIPLGWSPGVNKRSVSELALSFALGYSRNVFNSVNLMKNGIWEKNGGRLLSNMKFGIIGLGNIGFDLGKLLFPFGCEIVYFDLLNKSLEAKQINARFMLYNELLSYCDIVSFHVPNSNSTKNMYNKKAIENTKNGAFIINTSRGDIVDLEDVLQAVNNKKLAGYASDVFPEEPYDSSAWKDKMNILFTPHIGGSAEEAILAMGRSALEHINIYYKSN